MRCTSREWPRRLHPLALDGEDPGLELGAQGVERQRLPVQRCGRDPDFLLVTRIGPASAAAEPEHRQKNDRWHPITARQPAHGAA
jgi:hypothetical protein